MKRGSGSTWRRNSGKAAEGACDDRSVQAPMLDVSIADTGFQPQARIVESFQDDSVKIQDQGNPLQGSMRIMLVIMQGMGFYPDTVPVNGRRRYWLAILLKLLTLAYIGINAAVFGLNVKIARMISEVSGFLSMDGVASIMSGLKPCHGLLNLLVLGWRYQQHRALLTKMFAVDLRFRQCFHKSPIIRLLNVVIYNIIGIIILATLAARLAQYRLYSEKPGDNILSDISIILVPLLSIWQMLPLLYFEYLNRIIRNWFRELNHQLVNDKQLAKHRLMFYYERYLELADTAGLLDQVFSPFIFISLLLSVIELCLTIFFVTQAKPDVLLSEEFQQHYMYRLIISFYLIWTLLQVVAAIICVIVICASGTSTNEQARKISGTVLSCVPRDDIDRHVVVCFLQKIGTQHSWGLTVWGAFPIERYLLFTLVSIMGAYAGTLWELKQAKKSQCLTASDLYRMLNATDIHGLSKHM